MNVLKVKDSLGVWHSIPALKGDKGDPGAAGTSSQVENKSNVTGETVTDALNTINSAIGDVESALEALL